MKLRGLGVALISPFTEDSDLDIGALEKITEHLIVNRTDFLVLLGTTAETVNLTAEEKKTIIKTVKNINQGRVPLIVGIGGYNTTGVVREIKEFDTDGISGILSVSPYYTKPSQEGIYHHYEAIATASSLPVILYNVPGRTSSNVSAETTIRLARDFKNIVAIKEASGNLNQIMQIIHDKPADFTVISGDDALTLPMMGIGAEGVISVIGNAFPAEFSALIKAVQNNENGMAIDIQYRLLDLINLIFADGSPSGIKALLNLMGLCSAKVRLPLWTVSPELLNKMKIQLDLFYNRK
jgi:4-hydroxy-tetrahydrodipicolinate synthase